MSFSPARSADDAQGRATYGTANLSQEDAARHDVRVEVAPGPRMRADQTSSHALRPSKLVDGVGAPPAEERLPATWVEMNLQVLVDHRDGRIDHTEDALDLLESL